jgi:hypothetical protein
MLLLASDSADPVEVQVAVDSEEQAEAVVVAEVVEVVVAVAAVALEVPRAEPLTANSTASAIAGERSRCTPDRCLFSSTIPR